METAFTQPEYSKSGGCTQLVPPTFFEKMIPEDDSVRWLSQILEEIDYTKLNQAYSPKGRKPAVSPKNLFKVVVYGQMNQIYSCRKLEKACRRDLHFLYLLQGEPNVPDHNTIARFKKERLPHALEDLYAQFIQLLWERGEIAFETLYVDGTKMEANANRYTFVWRKQIEKAQERMAEKARLLLERCFPDYPLPLSLTLEGLQSHLFLLQQEVERSGIPFVHGKGKKKSALQRDYEELESYVERKTRYDAQLAIMGEDRNSYSKTDPDATFMRLKDDHMRNGQLKPAYNLQIGVEAEYIIHFGVFSDRNDTTAFIPFLRKAEEQHSFPHQNIVADAGYESEENYAYLEENGYQTFIKPQNHEAQKTKKYNQEIGRKENMLYDSEKDHFICQNGRHLRFSYESKRKTKTGYERTNRTYLCEDCSGCPFYEQCNRSRKGANKTIRFSPVFEKFRADSARNIATPIGIKYRVNRSIQVEGAFGVLKEDYHFRRFHTRGKKNVEVEFGLLCWGYNCNKLFNKMKKKRHQTYYHEVKTA